MERKRRSQFDLTKLNTAIDERASDAGSREASNVVEGDIGTAGIAGVPDVIAESPISISVPHQSSTRKRREVSSMSDRVNVEFMGDSRQLPVNDRSSPPSAWSGQVISDLMCQYLELENCHARSQLTLI